VTTTALTIKDETVAREKSWLRQRADNAGHPAGAIHAPEVVAGAFVGRLAAWYLTELQRRGL
jgi:hypothetical protein